MVLALKNNEPITLTPNPTAGLRQAPETAPVS